MGLVSWSTLGVAEKRAYAIAATSTRMCPTTDTTTKRDSRVERVTSRLWLTAEGVMG